MKLKYLSILILAMALLVVAVTPALAKGPEAGFGKLYYEGDIVRTVVPPAASPQEGRDDLYVIEGGAADQLPVVAVAPGDKDYHGGQWAFHRVTWNGVPYLLTSADEVSAAAAAGDVTIIRVAENDFKCPVQP